MVEQVQTQVQLNEHIPTFNRIIGLLALRSEIDREIENRLQETFEIDPEGLKKLASDATEFMLPYFRGSYSGPHTESPENVRGPSPSGTSPASSSHPIASLRIAKGWEDKLAALGVTTIAELENFIAAGKLVPGFAPRIGPDAVEKIKVALAKAGGVIVEANAKPPEIVIEAPQKTPEEIRAEGAEFARLGYKSSENPYQRGTSDWHQWDRGWQEQFSAMDADDEATREDVPATPESTPNVPADDFPEMNLATTPATPVATTFDTSDL